MTDFLLWLVFINVIGWLTFPICYFVFKNAYDRGYNTSKIIGLLLWGYLYWMGNLSGALSNDQMGAFTAMILLLFASAYFIKRNSVKNLFKWLKDNKQIVLSHELIFFFAFLAWAVVRGANPQISGTEKPMELAFINGIYRSPSFPPNDPWLSGYSISYYYFGYLIVEAIMHLLGTISGTAFNLAIALTFGLVAATSSGILVNLLEKKEIDINNKLTKKRLRQILLIALIAPLLILIVSNAEGFLEMIHSKGIFWGAGADGQFSSQFWQWLDILDISQAPSLPLDWKPSRMGGSWWWRASRVLQDYTVNGQSREIIDEFPFFSYLLADLHPHVLAMPFVLLAIYIGFYVFQYGINTGARQNKIIVYLKNPRIWFIAFTTGSLLFLNTWDFPIYFGLITLAYIVPLIKERGWKKERFFEFLSFAIPFGIVCIILYLPFLLSLSSQAGGLLPSLVYRTRGVHFLVMFFSQIMLLSAFLLVKVLVQKNRKVLTKIFIVGLAGILILFGLSLMVPSLSALFPQVFGSISTSFGVNFDAKIQNLQIANQSFLSIFGANTVSELSQEAISRFLKYSAMPGFLLLVLSSCLFLLFDTHKEPDKGQTEKVIHQSDQYVFILIILGTLLAIFPEFFYLRDQFGWRMNTIFKFYFQVWVLFSIASAYAIGNISYIKKKVLKAVLSIGAILVIAIGLVYPVFAILDKTNSFRNMEWSLDGNLFYELTNPEEAQAIAFLSQQPYGVVAEAIGGSYSNFGRVSRLTGFPTVLGWPGHELQWRGGGSEMGSRESDITQLYETYDWETAKKILDQYDIRYVFISSVEKNSYQVREAKFQSFLNQIFKNDDVVIYSYTGND